MPLTMIPATSVMPRLLSSPIRLIKWWCSFRRDSRPGKAMRRLPWSCGKSVASWQATSHWADNLGESPRGLCRDKSRESIPAARRSDRANTVSRFAHRMARSPRPMILLYQETECSPCRVVTKRGRVAGFMLRHASQTIQAGMRDRTCTMSGCNASSQRLVANPQQGGGDLRCSGQ